MGLSQAPPPQLLKPCSSGPPTAFMGMRQGTWHLRYPLSPEKERTKAQVSLASRGQREGNVRTALVSCSLLCRGSLCPLQGGSRGGGGGGNDVSAVSGALSPQQVGDKKKEGGRELEAGLDGNREVVETGFGRKVGQES